MRRRQTSTALPPWLVMFDAQDSRWAVGAELSEREAAWWRAREAFKRAHHLDWLEGDPVPDEPWDEAAL